MKQSFQIKSDMYLLLYSLRQLCFKIVFLGSSSVGKSSIIKRFLKNEFAMKSMSTVGVACESKVITIHNQQVKVQLWDTAGQERYRSLTKNYYRNCDAVVIVYDIANMKSFYQVKGWIADFEDKCERPAIKMLLGNKIDLNREVGIELGTLLAQKQKLLFQEVSAKQNTNVENAMIKLIEIMIQTRQIDSGGKLIRRGSLVESKSSSGDMSSSGISKSTRPVSYKPLEKDVSSFDTSKLQAIKSGGESSQEESPFTSGPLLYQTSPPTIIVTPPEDALVAKQDENNNMWLSISKHKKKSHSVSMTLKLVHPRESETIRDEYFLRQNANESCFCSC
uniref:Rab_C88 protein n=1 Tax=Paramecium tetraurelia TaxID=5888 RepID=Q3SDR8_PARTE|nr:rab_C88 [Paramecium tetraurelia]